MSNIDMQNLQLFTSLREFFTHKMFHIHNLYLEWQHAQNLAGKIISFLRSELKKNFRLSSDLLYSNNKAFSNF